MALHSSDASASKDLSIPPSYRGGPLADRDSPTRSAIARSEGLIVAWNLFDHDSCEAFRDRVRVDDYTWERGRAWALAIGLIAYPNYVETNPALDRVSLFPLRQVLTDIGLTHGHPFP